MENLSNALLSLYEKFEESPFVFFAFMLICMGGYILHSQIDNIADYFIMSPSEENMQFEVSLQRDKQINDALNDSKEFYGAHAIVIGQFHNGQYDLTRLPFTKVSITYLSGATGEMDSDTLYITRPISTMNTIMLAMWEDKEDPKCLSRKVDDLKDIQYRQRMQQTGFKFMTLCPLTNIRNYPIGYLSAGFLTEPTPTETEIILDYQRALSARVAGYLQEGTIREIP